MVNFEALMAYWKLWAYDNDHVHSYWELINLEKNLNEENCDKKSMISIILRFTFLCEEY